ncbi:ABC transporter ATP-binding protein [Halocatena halophila]|uniref:ABC transporter ATP-binding protein n=1 Tax=Halocatena halophila TaxID=2814576 RepID=UPI002ED0BC08
MSLFSNSTNPEEPAPKDDAPLISLKDVEVHFESNAGLLNLFSESQVVKAVDGVSLEIGSNDVVALVGESGCGKTTLGKAAIGLQRPTGGSVNYRGQDIWATNDNGTGPLSFSEIRRSLQIIHQDPGGALNPNKTVRDILSVPIKTCEPSLSPNDREARIHGMLERVRMSPPSDYAGRYPHQLSGGEQQRVALIRALLMNPDLILADEPVSALDVSLRVDTMDLLLELQEQFNTSFLFISHNISNARYLTEKTGGRIGVMYLGEIVEIGTPDEILHNPQHPYTKVLSWATPQLDSSEKIGDPPIRTIDIPDPVNPPSGCQFHTRCPKATEHCTNHKPALQSTSETHRVSCYRSFGDAHEYWDSPSIAENETTSITQDPQPPANDCGSR